MNIKNITRILIELCVAPFVFKFLTLATRKVGHFKGDDHIGFPIVYAHKCIEEANLCPSEPWFNFGNYIADFLIIAIGTVILLEILNKLWIDKKIKSKIS